VDTEETIRTRYENEYRKQNGLSPAAKKIETEINQDYLCAQNEKVGLSADESQSLKPMIWLSDDKYSHNSLLECLEFATEMMKNPAMKEEEKKELTAKIKEVNESVSEDQKKFVRFLEEEYKCSGLCSKSLFYITLPLKEGPPENTCTLSLIESIGDQFTLFGYSLFFTSIILLLVFILMMPLCCYDKEKLEDEIN